MVERNLSLAATIEPSPSRWLEVVLSDFDEFLKDHASCEKKASGMAMSVASHYPDQPKLLTAMVDLAVEELSHYREVVRLLLARNVIPGADQKDPYIHSLNRLIRRGPEHFLLDRLLIGAVVERRGAERFGMIAKSLTEPELKQFYEAITISEERHWMLFVELACDFYPTEEVYKQLTEFTHRESEIMTAQPARPALH
jgi:tRNA-(ms[2]io[6]A)-hydroxylase